jgi:hypothetical protein
VWLTGARGGVACAQLRKCCNHPFLFPGAEVGEETSCDELVAASGKLQVPCDAPSHDLRRGSPLLTACDPRSWTACW